MNIKDISTASLQELYPDIVPSLPGDEFSFNDVLAYHGIDAQLSSDGIMASLALRFGTLCMEGKVAIIVILRSTAFGLPVLGAYRSITYVPDQVYDPYLQETITPLLSNMKVVLRLL